jgi:transcriptional regulator with XRE-family HTH domain
VARSRRVEQAFEGDRLRIHVAITQCKVLRLERGLSQGDIARLMATSQSAVSDIESLEKDIQLATLARYARACGGRVSIDVEEVPDRG